jgi:hypothetical protein
MPRVMAPNPLRASSAIAALVVLAVTAVSSPAHADSACIAAYEQTQTLRKDGKPAAARAQAVTCARDSCPALLAKDCTKWLAELDAVIPTVVLDPRSPSGALRTDVRVKLDGAPFTEKIDGKALPVEPGSRRFTFEAPGAASAESTVVVKEGEKLRKITVTLAPVEGAGATRADGERPIPTGVWIFGGVSVIALATSAVFALDGLGRKSDLDECKPRCAPEDVDAMSTRFTLADVSLGAGVMAGAAALYLFLTRPTAEAREATAKTGPYAAPTQGGAAFGVISRF